MRILPLAPPTYVVGDPSEAVVAVTDDDRGLRIRDATHSEESRTPDGREDLEMEFRVTLDQPEEQTVTVNWATQDDTARAGEDYIAASGSLSFAPGVTEQTFSVTVVNDWIEERAESFTVVLTGAVNARLAEDTATGTITDADRNPEIYIESNPEAVVEGQNVVFTLARDSTCGECPSDQRPATVTVNIAMTQKGAFVSEPLPTEVYFGPQPRTVALEIPTVDDDVDEADGWLELAIVEGAGYFTRTTRITRAVVTILDNDGASTPIVLNVVPQRLSEAGPTEAKVAVALPDGSRFAEDKTVVLAVDPASATAGDGDYTLSGTQIVIRAGAGAGEAAVTLTVLDDPIDEEEETLTLKATLDGEPVGEPRTVSISDDDTRGVTLSETELIVPEGGSGSYTVVLDSQPTAAEVTILVRAPPDTDVSVSQDQASLTFTPSNWSQPQTVTVEAAHDPDAEADPAVVLTHTVSGGDYQSVTASNVIVTISDDDTASTGIALTLDPERVTEQGGQQTVTVTAMLNAVSRTEDTVVNVVVAGDTATVVDDFAAIPSFSITIPANQPSGQNTFSLTPVNDAIAEGEETLQVDGTAMGLTVAPATLTISDDDTASTGIALTLDPEQVTEQGGQQTVTVMATLNAGTRAEDTVVQVSVAGDTATVGADFQMVSSFAVTIPANQTSGEADFSLTPVDDAVAEGNEAIEVSGTATGLTVAPALLTLADNDEPSTEVSLVVRPERLGEEADGRVLEVRGMLNAGARTVDTVVTLTVTGDTAEAEDFQVFGNLELTIPANQQSGMLAFLLVPTNDSMAEGDETLTVSGTATGLTVNPATFTISDDDTASTEIKLTLNPERVTEDGRAQTVTVMAMLNAGARTEDTVVQVSVAGDTATVVEDFQTVPSFAVTIPANRTSGEADFSLTPVDDAVAEGDETLQASGTATGLTVDGATLTIGDDDTASTGIELTLAPERVTEQGGQQTVTITAMLNAGARPADTLVTVTVAGNTATVVEDFGAVPSFDVTIPATEASATGTFTLTPVDDAIAEGEEALTVSGTSALPVTGADLTLADDDTTSTGIALTLDPEQVTEQGGQQTVTVTAMLNAGTRTADTVVNVTVAGDTATVGDDYGAVSNFSITIRANQPSGQNTFALTPVNDAIAEGNETLQVSGATTGLTVTPATLTISDDDTASTGIALTLDPEQVTEQGGPQTVAVTAMLNAGARTAETVVQVSVAEASATEGTDFAAVGNFQIIIPAGAGSGEADFSVTPVDDAIAEGEETLTVDGSASGLTVDPATLTISDNDTASTGIALTLNPQRITEQGGQQTVTVTAMLNAGARTADTVVRVTVAGDTATVVEDFAAISSFNVTIPANQPSGEADFSLTPVNDTVAEGDETLQVSGTATGLTVTPATLTLADDDTASTGIALALDPVRVTEQGDQQTVTVTAMLNAGARTENTAVNVTVAGLTATAMDDFQAVPSFTVTIPATQTSGQNSFTLTPVNDAVAEGNETLQVGGTATGLTVTGAELTISDDDTASTGIALTLDPEQVTEDGGAQAVTVTAMLDAGARAEDTMVNVSVAGDTATMGDDFATVPSFNVTIPATEASATATFTLTPVNDAIAEGDETLQVSGVATGLTVDRAMLTISDDDTSSTEIELTLNPERVTEDGGAQTVTVTAMLNAGARTADTVVQVSVAGETATVVDDFGAVGHFSITILANQPSGEADFRLTPVNDAIADGDETLQVSGTSALPVTAATLTISDDDTASTGITLTLDPERVGEDGGQQPVMVTAMLDAGTRTEDTVVNVSVAGASATEGTDFTAVGNFQITIPANQAGGTGAFGLTPVNDVIAEGDETLRVSGTAALPVTAAELTLADDDTASTGIALTLNPEQVTEDGGAQTVRVTAMLNAGAHTADTVVNVTVAGLTATEVADFGAVSSFNVTIPATAASVTGAFSLTPVNDAVAEGEETLTVSGTATGLTVDPVTLILGDDDIASSSIALSLDPDEVTEQGSQQTVTVTAMLNAGARTTDTVVDVSVAGLTATVGADFGAVSSFNVTIPATAASATGAFSLTPVNDAIAEGEETLTVSGASPLPVTPATLTLADDDIVSTGIALTLNPEQVTEDGGAQTVTVTAMLNAGTRTQNTVVQVTVAGDTAIAVEDFAAVSSFNVTIPATAASATGTFSLTPVNDAVAEGEETLTVSGASPLPVTPATLTLADDDIASTGIALSLDPQQVSEDGGAQTVSVTAMLNAGTRTQNTVVQVTVAGNTATEVEDFAAVSTFNVTIPANQASGQNTFSLTPVNDTVAEGEETLQVSGTATGLAVDGAALTISDDDIASTGIALTLEPEQVTEQGGHQTVTVTAMLNAGARTANTVVNMTVAGDTATVVDDFAVVQGFQITIPATEASATGTFLLTPVNDTTAEGDETLQVSGSATGLTVDGATLVLGDDDTASTGIALTLDPVRVTEQGGQQTVTVTATLDAGARTADTVVNVTVAGDTATAVDDFQAVPSLTVTIPATQTSGQNSFTLTPVNETIAEGDETLRVSGTSALPVTAARLTLGDDDIASSSIALSLDPDEVTEQGGQQTVTVTATLDAGARTADTVVNVSVAGLTATEVEDFAAVSSFNVTIPATAASATGTFSLTPFNDAVAEGEETLRVSGTSALPVTAATLTISDDDTASTGIELTLNPERVSEQGGQQTVTVTAALDAGARTGDTLVNVTVAGDTATAVDDFQAAPSFTVTIPATQTSGQNSFALTPVNDAIAEGNETLTVSGTSALPVTGAELTISDDDTASTGIALMLDPVRVTEQDGQQTVTVTAMLDAGARAADTVVNVTVAGDTATVVDDFAAVQGFQITIPATEASATSTFLLTPVNDTTAEGDETLQVSGSATGLTVDGATLVLGDDDTASTGIALTLDPVRVTEQGGQQTVTVTATLDAGARTEDTVVNVTVAGDTATVGDDFGAVSDFSITIRANQPSGQNTFALTPFDDAIAEGEETLTVSGAATDLTVTPATLTIGDDDTASTGIALTLDPERVNEQGGQQTVTVTAMLNAGARTADTVVNMTVAGDTATVGGDFGAVSDFSITIRANQPSGQNTFALTPANDAIAEGDETLQVRGAATDLTVTPATLTIGDDDTASTGIALTLDPMPVTEQGGQQTVTVTATLDAGARTADTVVNVTVAGDTATAVDDFQAVPSFTVTILATQTSGQNSFALTPVNDAIAEGNETLTVSGTSALPVTGAELTISDDDTASTGIALMLDPVAGHRAGRAADGHGDRDAECRRPHRRHGGQHVGGRGHGHGRGRLRCGAGLPDHHRGRGRQRKGRFQRHPGR